MHRDRRRGIRRVLEISELIASGGMEDVRIELNTIFRWIPSKDTIMQWGKSHRVLNDIRLFTGMDEEELGKNLAEKKRILEWMVKNDVNDINEVGKLVSEYYTDPDSLLKRLGK